MKKKDVDVQVTPPNVHDESVNVQDTPPNVQDTVDNVQVAPPNVQDTGDNVQVTTPNVQVEPPNVQVAPQSVQVAKPKKVVNKPKVVVKKEVPPVEPPKEKSRKGYTAILSIEESQHLDGIIQNRITAGLSINSNHFLRQCIDFAINSEHFIDRGIEARFATHDTKRPWEYKLLKDALFDRKNTGLTVCK